MGKLTKAIKLQARLRTLKSKKKKISLFDLTEGAPIFM